MDLSPASGFKRRALASSSPSGDKEIAWSPTPCSPSLSPSSPSSNPSSPLSTSSSVCINLGYQSHVKGQTQGTEVAKVSSTSASLAKQSLSLTTPNTTSLESLTRASVQPGVDCEEEGKKMDMYDPFNEIEGVKGEEGEKYDPFDPTGSPESDPDGIAKVRGVKRNAERCDEEGEQKEEPPDSTYTLADRQSPRPASRLPLRRRVDCSTAQAGEHRGSAESDHSEIEEGEIVGATDRNGNNKRPSTGEVTQLNSPSVSFFGSKPERILRVLDGDGFVSVCTESSWDVDMEPEDEPVVGVEDLRRKLVNRRKERYLSFPSPSPISPQSLPPPSNPPSSTPSPPLTLPVQQGIKNHSKSSKISKDHDQPKSKNRKAGDKEERRKKSRKDKEGCRERSKEKERGHKSGKEVKQRRSSRSSSRKRKKKTLGSPELSRSCSSSGRGRHTRHSFSSLSLEMDREKDKDRERDRGRERDRDRDRDGEQSQTTSQRRDERARDSNSKSKDRQRKRRQHSSSRERGVPKRSKPSREKRDEERDGQHERERRLDGRPVVPPSIQDLTGPDLFAIKRTITVTTTTTTTTVPGSPRLGPASPGRPPQDSDKPHKRKKKRKWHSAGEMEEQGSCHSQSQSPPRYQSYESDHYSDKLEIDVLSLDGEALDSDYPYLEDTPPAALPPEQTIASPKTKTIPKTGRHHPKKKSYTLKKMAKSQSSSSNKTKSKCLSSLTVTSGPASTSSGLPSTKRARKVVKTKNRDKSSRKDLSHSGKSKKESGVSRKGKLQSKVSVLVREGVSSTTGASVGSGKLGMDLMGPGGTGGGTGSSAVGGSIAVVFCRDNESRSPFLKPCSEPLSRSKDMASMGKRSSLAAPPSSLSSPSGLKSKKTKASSITSTSSSASSPSSSLTTKRRRRLAKKTREKAGVLRLTAGDGSQTKALSEGWGGVSVDQSASGEGSKSVSPHTSQAGPLPCSSSSSSSTSVLPPSSPPPHTPPPSMAPLRDTRESSPDSQTVDSSCKTPDLSFLAEDCPSQTSPTLQASSPSHLPPPQGAGVSVALSAPTAKPPSLDDAPKLLASPPCSSSTASCGPTSISLSSADPSSSSVSSSSASKPHPPPPESSALPWSLQSGVDCTTGGVLALTALLFKMEEANIASRAKAQEFIQATSQILSQANQSQAQQLAPPSSSSHIPPPPSLPLHSGPSPAQFLLHSSKTPPPLFHPSTMGGGCAQTPPFIMPGGLTGSFGDTDWDLESKDPDKYLKKLHTQERAVEEVKLAIKPYYQRKDINKDEYKDILRKAVHKICHSRTGEINPVKVSNLVKLYVQRYKYFRKHGRKMDEEEREDREPGAVH
ncbi:hypothetical protein CgunFtcFv8_007885 [Champsocephalus gunnari]|uniref:SFR19-like C-terminal domain-containing protein n=1 Tax=Champsocephalus gunnari TaxID=52237 RepID=A0AAN8CZV4_CHAGU|nr:hypothetical protein CgunFtcFv8_007885 [Champsocephalus gunnari]